MATYSDDVLVRMGVDKKQFERDMRGIPALIERALTPVYKAFLKPTEALNSLGRAAGKAFGRLDQALGKFGVSLGAAAAFAWVKNLVSQTDALKDSADYLGVNIEWLQRMRHAADMNGSSAEYLSEKLMRLNQVIGDAIENGGASAEAFGKWKISLTNADGTAKNTQQVLGDIANRMRDARDATEQATIANDFFGRGAGRLIPLLKEGADGLKAMGAGAVIMSEEAIEKVARLNDGFMAVKNTISSIAVETFSWLDKTMGAVPRLLGAFRGGEHSFWGLVEAGANQREIKKPGEAGVLPGATTAQIKAIADAKKELDKALKASRLDNMTEAEKLNELEREREEIDKRLLKMSKEQVNGADGMRALTELVEKDHEIAQQKNKVEQKISREKKKQVELSRQLRDVEREHQNALIEARNKERDRRLFTFEEIAQGQLTPGNRFLNANILAARRASALDYIARDAEARGRGDIGARASSMADSIRAQMGLLKSDERMPFMQMSEQLEKSREAIERIEAAITNLGKE